MNLKYKLLRREEKLDQRFQSLKLQISRTRPKTGIIRKYPFFPSTRTEAIGKDRLW